MTEPRLGVVVLCLTCSLLLTVSGYSIPGKRSGLGVPLSSFRLTKVTQQRTEDSTMVQLHFQGYRLPTVIMIPDDLSTQERIPMGPDGVAQFNMNHNKVHIILLHRRGYQTLDVRLMGGHYSEQLVPNTEIYIQEGKDVKFERGYDADVHIVVTFNHLVNGGRDTSIFPSFIMRSTTEEHVVERYDNRNVDDLSPYEFIDVNRSEYEVYAHMRIYTASGDVKGLLGLEVATEFNCSQECLLGTYTAYEDVPVYPAEDAGPFSRNFVGILKNRHNDEGFSQKYCSVHSSCSLTCEFFGDRPTSVKFIRADQPEVILENQISLSNTGFYALGHLEIRAVGSSDEGPYQCKSSSGFEEASRTVDVIVIHDAHINHALSNVATLNDGTVEVTCVAEGIPLPTLNFLDSRLNQIEDVNSEHYQIIMTELNDTTSEAILRITDAEVATNLSSVICTAANKIHEQNYMDAKQFLVSETGSTFPPMVLYYLMNYVGKSDE